MFGLKHLITAISRGNIVLILAGLLSVPTSTFADCDPQFTQVNEDGFGDPFNIYAWSIEVFNGLMYVGTLNQKNGAEIWRYDGSTWEQVVDNGFGNPNNTGVRNLITFDQRLYAGVMNEVEGAGIWRSDDGVNWTPVVQGGFGDPGNTAVRGMIRFKGRLYAGLQNMDGSQGELWRSYTGVRWTPITLQGFGSPNNSSMHTMERFGGMLYVGTRNTNSGTQLWRSEDGENFEQVVGPRSAEPGGYGNPNNGVTFALKKFNDQLYAGTGNLTDGFGLYRTPDGVQFEQIGEHGFGDSDNAYAWRLHRYEKHLWLGVTNTNLLFEGGSLWRSPDGNIWEEMVGANGSYMGYGFDDTKNWGVRSFTNYNGKLYIGTAQCWFESCDLFVTGAEVWEWPGESCP